MHERIERIRKAAADVIETAARNAPDIEYFRVWTELENAIDPHVLLELIACAGHAAHVDGEPAPTAEGFYAAVNKDSGVIRQTIFAECKEEAEKVLLSSYTGEVKAAMVVEKVSVVRTPRLA